MPISFSAGRYLASIVTRTLCFSQIFSFKNPILADIFLQKRSHGTFFAEHFPEIILSPSRNRYGMSVPNALCNDWHSFSKSSFIDNVRYVGCSFNNYCLFIFSVLLIFCFSVSEKNTQYHTASNAERLAGFLTTCALPYSAFRIQKFLGFASRYFGDTFRFFYSPGRRTSSSDSRRI